MPGILDHYLRKPEDIDIVAGTLLGTANGNKIDICSSFAVPLMDDVAEEDEDTEQLLIDSVYQEKMLKFYRKVS